MGFKHETIFFQVTEICTDLYPILFNLSWKKVATAALVITMMDPSVMFNKWPC